MCNSFKTGYHFHFCTLNATHYTNRNVAINSLGYLGGGAGGLTPQNFCRLIFFILTSMKLNFKFQANRTLSSL